LTHSQKPLTRRWGRYNLLKSQWQISRIQAFYDSIKIQLRYKEEKKNCSSSEGQSYQKPREKGINP